MTIRLIIKKILRIYPWIRKRSYMIFNLIVFQIYGVDFGKKLRLYDRIYLTILKNGSLKIGDNFTMTSGDGINPLCRNLRAKILICQNAIIKIGNNTGLSSPCLWAKESITIGNNVNVGGDCIIMDTDVHCLDYKVRSGIIKDESGNSLDGVLAKSAPIIIEDYVFVGTRSIILKGVTIGARSIIAAGSVVTKSIPPDCIAGGNPCKVLRYINGRQ